MRNRRLSSTHSSRGRLSKRSEILREVTVWYQVDLRSLPVDLAVLSDFCVNHRDLFEGFRDFRRRLVILGRLRCVGHLRLFRGFRGRWSCLRFRSRSHIYNATFLDNTFPTISKTAALLTSWPLFSLRSTEMRFGSTALVFHVLQTR